MRAYCLKCKADRDIIGSEPKTLKNGRRATKGVCEKPVFRIGST